MGYGDDEGIWGFMMDHPILGLVAAALLIGGVIFLIVMMVTKSDAPPPEPEVAKMSFRNNVPEIATRSKMPMAPYGPMPPIPISELVLRPPDRPPDPFSIEYGAARTRMT